MSLSTRTVGQAVSDIRFARHFGEMNQRFWSHVDTTLTLIGAVGGSAAFAGAVASNTDLATWSGFAIALASVLQLVFRPGQRAVEFRDAKRQFAELETVAWGLPILDLDARLIRLQESAPVGFALLAQPAFNAAMAADGHPQGRPLKWYERLALALA